jgi:hypothetical protein
VTNVAKLPPVEANLAVALEEDVLDATASVDIEAKLELTLAHHEARPPRPDV